MKPRIFFSAVSAELARTRQLVANVLTRLGYEPVWQDIFGTEPGDLRQVLRDKIDGCDGLIQLVGHAYGSEPPGEGVRHFKVQSSPQKASDEADDVGRRRLNFEVPDPVPQPADEQHFGRCSYTQFEFLYAQLRGK